MKSKFIIILSFISHILYSQELKLYDSINIKISDVDSTSLNNINLNEVLLKHDKYITSKNGILIVNIENDIAKSSGNFFETIKNTPTISYNQINNSFKIKGIEGVQIHIDGQDVYLKGNELIEYLKSLSSDDIKQIEIESNPSAKMEANGSGGIINIITKRNKNNGLLISSNISSKISKYFGYDFNIRGQYNTSKRKFLIQYKNSDNSDYESAIINRFSDNNNSKQKTFAKINNFSNNINIQFENEFRNSKFLLRSSIFSVDEHVNQATDLKFDNIYEILSIQDSKNKPLNFDVSIKYDYNLNNKSNIISRFSYINYDISESSILKSHFVPDSLKIDDLLNKSPNKVNMFVYQFDYNNQIDSTFKIETGLKIFNQKINNSNYFYKNKLNNDSLINEYSSEYNYSEHIIGLYTQLYKKIKDIDIILGGRYEINPIKGYNSKNNHTSVLNNESFFPFLNLSYKNFNLSYSKKINRVPFSYMMPFVYYIDPNTTIEGNPELKPSFSNKLEFQYVLKNKYIFSLSHAFIKNAFYQTPIQDQSNLITVLKPFNYDRSSVTSFNSNISLDILKNWSMNINLGILYNKIESDNKINSNKISGELTISNSFKIKDFKIDVNGEYFTPFINGVYETKAFYALNAGISKSFLSKKLRFSIFVNDILKSYKLNSTSLVLNQRANMNQIFNTHYIKFSVSYTFRKGETKNNNDVNNSLDEYKDRVK